MKERACYIAGRMTGIKGMNFPAFMRAHKKLKKRGWIVYNPAEMDLECYGSLKRIRKELMIDPKLFRKEAVKRDLNVLIDMLDSERGDAIVMLQGWRKSNGARAEYAVARWLGLRRLSLRRALR